MLARDDVKTVQLSVTDREDAMQAMMGGSGSLMYVIFNDDTENFQQVQADIKDYLEDLDHPGTWQTQDFVTGDLHQMS